jgi:gamma-glutamylcyclotransferase (GGCT)/AIG2-like uncharacterized protein YtfP
MDELPLFVFGTLRRGEPNHGYLEHRYTRWLPGSVRGFRRGRARHGFPAMLPAPGESVSGEVFFLDPVTREKTLRECDLLEDLPPGKLVGEFYQRAKVIVETAEGPVTAWAYVDPSTSVDTAGCPTAIEEESSGGA